MTTSTRLRAIVHLLAPAAPARRPRRVGLLLLLAAATMLCACSGAATGTPAGSSATGAPGASPRDLTGTTWRAILLRDVPPLAGAEPTIRFEPGQAGGTTGCNTYGGAWTLKPDGSFTIASMVMTEMGCDGPRGTQETVVLDVLQHVDHLEFLADGTIRLTGSSGSITFAEDPR